MISYKTYKLINENFGTPMAFGFSPTQSIGVQGSRLSEMGLRPDEMEELEDDSEEFDEFGNPIKKSEDDEESDMDSEFGSDEEDSEFGLDGSDEEMGSEMGSDDENSEFGSDEMGSGVEDAPFPPEKDDEMGSGVEDAPFPPEKDDDMASLAGIGDPDMTDMESRSKMDMEPKDNMDMDTRVEDPDFDMGALSDDMGMDDDFEDEDMDDDFEDDFEDEDEMDMDDEDDEEEDDMEMISHPMQSKRLPMESKKHMCDEDDDEDEDSKPKKDKKFNFFGKKDDKNEKEGKDKKPNFFGKKDDKKDKNNFIKKDKKEKDEDEVKEESFWNSFLANASGNVRKIKIQEDAIIPPTNVNTPLASPQGIGSNQEPVKNDYFGFTSVEGIPSFHDYVEWKNMTEAYGDKMPSSLTGMTLNPYKQSLDNLLVGIRGLNTSLKNKDAESYNSTIKGLQYDIRSMSLSVDRIGEMNRDWLRFVDDPKLTKMLQDVLKYLNNIKEFQGSNELKNIYQALSKSKGNAMQKRRMDGRDSRNTRQGMQNIPAPKIRGMNF